MDIDVAILATADVRRANIPELRRALNSMFANAKDVATLERLVSHVLGLAQQAPSTGVTCLTRRRRPSVLNMSPRTRPLRP